MRLTGTHSLATIIGYILSPLSWWNDLYINVPLAYFFSIPFSLINEALFMVSFIVGYWLSNLLGMMLLQWGGMGILGWQIKMTWRSNIVSALLYSILLVVLMQTGWLPSPVDIMSRAQ